MGGAEDQVYLFFPAHHRYSLAQIVEILKCISVKVIFREFPEFEKQSWGSELLSNEYFIRSGGDKITSEIVRRHIRYQGQEQLVFDI
jgi:REP element-mobilizing transposase RayT